MSIVSRHRASIFGHHLVFASISRELVLSKTPAAHPSQRHHPSDPLVAPSSIKAEPCLPTWLPLRCCLFSGRPSPASPFFIMSTLGGEAASVAMPSSSTAAPRVNRSPRSPRSPADMQSPKPFETSSVQPASPVRSCSSLCQAGPGLTSCRASSRMRSSWVPVPFHPLGTLATM
jgi:hypothetical protein